MPNDARPEAREFSRARIPVTVHVLFDGVEHRTEKVRDVSLSGLFLELPGLAPTGSHCRINLQLNPPEGPQVMAEGSVVRSNGEGIGIVLLELIGLESLEHLRNLILYHGDDPDQLVSEFLQHDGLLRRI